MELKPEKIPPSPQEILEYAVVVAEGEKQYQLQLRFLGGMTRAMAQGCGGAFKITPL